MSRYRLSRAGGEAVHASIEPERIALVKLGRGREVLAQTVLAIAPGIEPEGEAWTALQALLAEPAWRGGRRHVVVSDHYARYLVCARPRGLRSLKELAQVMDNQLAQRFDLSPAEWMVRYEAPPFDSHLFACALPRTLVQVLRRCIACASLQPYLVCELNRVAQRLPRDTWFASVARDYIAMVGAKAGRPCVIRRLPYASESGDAATLAATIAREQLLLGSVTGGEERPCLLTGLLPEADDGTTLTRLDLPRWGAQSRAWSRDSRLALAGVWP